METEYIELFVDKPYWDYSQGRWRAWVSDAPIDGGYKVRVPLPQELVAKRLEDAEIVPDERAKQTQ